jgi:Tol biopolymer transport system component
MPAWREIGVLVLATVVSVACCTVAFAIPANSTILLSRPSGLGALPVPGDNFSSLGPKALSGDGNHVVFVSAADDLGVSDARQHVWFRDTLAGTTTLVDRVAGGGPPADGDALIAALSRDASTVCFLSEATNLVPGATGVHVFVATLSTGAIVLADRATGAGGAVGNADAAFCSLDATGTRVVFESDADNLVPNDTNTEEDIFVRDLGADTTERVSLNAMGLQASGGGRNPSISGDGLKVAFASGDGLVADDDNNTQDVFVWNRQTSTLVRASLGTGSVEANGPSFENALDDTGSFVAFTSVADNLEPGDTNGRFDVFWRALGSDTTILVSRATGGSGALGDDHAFSPAISGDGLGVAFRSGATNFGDGPPPPGGGRVYLRRLGTNVTTLLSRATGATGDLADADAATPSLATAPTVAVFASSASNLDPGASGEFPEVFRRTLSGTPETTLVSRPGGTAARNALVNDSRLPFGSRAVGAEGRLVVFESTANGLDPAASDALSHVFVRDTVSNTTTLVDRGPGPAGTIADARAEGASIAASGSHVAFLSSATNLLAGVTGRQVYVRDLATGGLEVASRADGPAGALAAAVNSTSPALSADGRRVVFIADDPLVSGDTNGQRDVYLRDLVAGTTTLVSVAAGGGAGDDRSFRPSLSHDGMRVAFTSRATNLLPGGPIAGDHVYVRDLLAGTTVLVDRDEGGAPGTGRADSPEISGAGTHVAFHDDQALTSDAIPQGGAIFVRDLAADVTVIASREDGPEGAVVGASFAVVSIDRDGTRVGWVGASAGLPGGADTQQAYVRDLAAGTTRLVSAVGGTVTTPADAASVTVALDASGACAAFESNGGNLTALAYPTRDFAQVYLRALDDRCLATASTTSTTLITTSTTLPPGSGTAIPAKTVVLRPGKLVKLVAKGFPAPAGALGDPTVGGGSLVVEGASGSASFPLASSGWKAVGRGEPRGFKFKGGGCRATVLRRRIKVACRGETGALQLPEPGPLRILLVVGNEAYCAECGGTSAGRPTRVFKRGACPAPATCP